MSFKTVFLRFSTVAMLLLLCIVPNQNMYAWGSSYSLYGIGDIMMSPNTRSLGLGGVTAPLFSTMSIIPENPASWSAIREAILQGSLDYDIRSSQSPSGGSYFAESAINGASLAFPLYSPMGISLAFGFNPLSQVNYNVSFLNPQGTFDTNTTYTTQYEGSGGLSTFFVGSSIAPLDWLALGGSLEYNFGTTTYAAFSVFSTQASSSGFSSAAIYNRSSPAGLDGRFSAIASFGDLTLAGIVRLPATLNTQFTQTYASTTAGLNDSSMTVSYSQTLPLSYTLGAGFHIKDFLLVGDVTSTNWNSLLISGAHPGNIRTDYRFSLGIERAGNTQRYASFFDRCTYRFGGYYWQTYYIVNGTPINEIFTTLGMGLPVGQKGSLDLALQYGTEGTTNNNLIKESIFRLNATFSIGELLTNLTTITP